MFTDVRKEYINTLQSRESYKKGYSFYPSITKWWQVSFKYKGISLQTKQFIASGYLPSYGKKLSAWMEEENVENVTLNVIQSAIQSTKQNIKTITVDGKKVKSSEQCLYLADEDNKVLKDAFAMEIAENKPVMLSELLDQEDVCLERCKYAYLYRYSAYSIQWGTHEEVKDQDVLMGEHVAYRILETFDDKLEERELETFDDALAYSAHLQDNFCYAASECSRIIKIMKVSHQLWDALTFEEIEHFITTYIEDEDERERINLKEAKRLKEAQNG